MPWCDDCDKFWNPNSMPPDGRCRNCGAQLSEAVSVVEGAGGAGGAEGDEYRAPWHFKLLIVATVVYLGWRLFQLVEAIVS